MIKQRNRHVLGILVFESILGSGTFEWFPAWIQSARSAVWIPFVVYSMVTLVLAFILVNLAQRIQMKDIRPLTLFDGCLPNRILRFVFHSLLLIVFVVKAALILRVAIYEIHYVAMPNTPNVVLALLAMLIPLQLLSSSFDSLVRYQTTLYWPTLIVAIVMLLLCMQTADFGNLLPLWPYDWHPILHMLPDILYILPGLLLCLEYFPLFRLAGLDAQPMYIHVFIAVTIVLLLQALNLLIVLINFGPFEGAALNFPVMEAIRMEHSGRGVVLFLIPVLISISSALNLYTYGAYRILEYHTQIRRLILAVGVLCGVTLLSLLLGSWQSMYRYYIPIVETVSAFVYVCAFGLWLWQVGKGKGLSPR
ncbi:MAG: spore germination protein [Alicyclobacillus herbarius]|uniref:GerAB/ArcD/ProY family transporter n=1 Tax=Alicyclobacillus herbarius TaxID=122960 RepID=UPI002352FC4C|nr:GerAB/ArcD/ProY family transporter [Alicyclobacillus herbarius]MCL6633785.1 spore germination protein [Alicyclobacillus herbarius]